MIKTVLITGCSNGLGKALALQFAKNNCYVYAVGRDWGQLEKLAETSLNIKPILADITTESGRLKIKDHLADQNEISLIHNAAMLEPSLFNLTSEAALRGHFETNYFAPLFITRDLWPWLNKGQRILHITSGAAYHAVQGLIAYSTAKAAMQFAIQCLNVEYNSEGIYCANLRPGMLDTRMGAKLREIDANIFPKRDYYIQLEKEKKLIKPEIAAEFIVWVLLKTDDLAFSTTLWNIYDKEFHQYWLPKDTVIAQLPVY